MNGASSNARHLATRAGPALLCLLGVLAASDAVGAAAGRFQFVVGDVRVLPAAGGVAVPVRRGAQVEQGDTVITAANGVAQLRMVDDALLAVRPATRLRIEEYRFEQPERQDRSLFSLLSGAFRSVTGLIGQRNVAGYQVYTSTATIGIRGSDADIGHDETTRLTAVRTYDGVHVVTARDQTGPGASLVTGPGDIAVVLPGQLPRFAAEFPFAIAPARPAAAAPAEPAGSEDGGTARTDEGPRRAAADGETADGDAGRTLGPRPPPVRTLISTAGASALDVVRLVPPGTAVAGGYLADIAGMLEASAGALVVNPPRSAAALGPANELVLVFDQDDVGAFRFLAAGGTLRRVEPFVIPGPAGVIAARGTWGLWQGDFLVVDEGAVPATVGGFPFAVADRATRVTEIAALGGTAFTYTRIGGAITNERGALPTAYNLTATGVFGSGPLLGAVNITGNADFGFGSSGWTMNGSGSVRALLEGDIVLGGACTGCAAPVGEAGGQFVGARAEGLLLGVGLADTATGKGVIGSAVLRR